MYIMYKDSQNQWRWRYVTSNHRIIAVSSEAYFNKSDCLASINIMKASGGSSVHEV